MPSAWSQLIPICRATADRPACCIQLIARHSNNIVKRLVGSAHGTRTVRTPCSRQFVRGTAACTRVRYWQVSRCLHARDASWSYSGQLLPHSGQYQSAARVSVNVNFNVRNCGSTAPLLVCDSRICAYIDGLHVSPFKPASASPWSHSRRRRHRSLHHQPQAPQIRWARLLPIARTPSRPTNLAGPEAVSDRWQRQREWRKGAAPRPFLEPESEGAIPSSPQAGVHPGN
jgi:hypothetical protein